MAECKFSWCHNIATARGMCPGHNSHYHKYGEANPPSLARLVGSRPLVAQTCKDCGELKMGSEFPTNTVKGVRYYRRQCRPCMKVYNDAHPPKEKRNRSYQYNADAYAKLSPEQKAKARRYMIELNASTQAQAKHKNQPYTDADWAVLLRNDLTSLEKALLIGRTYRGVENQLYKYRQAVKAAEEGAT